MDDNIRTKLAEISAQWRSAGKIGPAVSKSVSQAYELGKADGIKEGLRRAAEIANEPEPECCGKPDIDRRDGSQSCCGSPDPRPRTADEIFTAILAEADK